MEWSIVCNITRQENKMKINYTLTMQWLLCDIQFSHYQNGHTVTCTSDRGGPVPNVKISKSLMSNVKILIFNVKSLKTCIVNTQILKMQLGIFSKLKIQKGSVFLKNKWFNDECKNMKKLKWVS